ncbi:MAG: S1C family serine protease [Eubacterium sp.]
MDDFFNNKQGTNEEKSKSEEGRVNGEYHFVPPKSSNEYYNPQQNQQSTGSYQQPGYNNYYTPPTYNNASRSNNGQTVVNGAPVDAKPKKKKNKTAIIIAIIIVICAAVAVGGLAIAAYTGKTDNQPSVTDEQKSNSNDDAAASVKGSNEAAKTDSDGNLTAAGVAQKAMDSCVGITVYTQQSAYSYFYNYGQNSNESGEESASGEGSGVIMSESNGKTYIMTCAHVIADGSSFKVTLNDDTEYDAEMVGYDSQTDIGVLSINKTGLQIAEFGDSADIEVGATCIAIGCPGGLEFKNSVTQGIISALDRPVSSSIGYSNECIQVDAAINPGNSGGALFNMQGQVIGINSSKIASTEYEGMGFAVPSNTAVETANSLIKNGYVAGRAKLGVQYVSLENYNNASAILSALAQQGFEDASGTMVLQSIDDESDLKNSDVQQYDMIVAVDGKTMTSTDVLTSVLSNSKPGDTVTLTMARVQGNSIKTFKVKCKLIESKD